MAQTPRNLKLKKLKFTDTDGIDYIWKLRNAHTQFFFYNKPINWTHHYSWAAHRLNDPAFDFYLIMLGRKRIGTIAVEHRPDCEFLQNLIVEEQYRGRGIAKWAIRQLMKPNRFIVGQAWPTNKAMLKAYEQLGFWRVRR